MKARRRPEARARHARKTSAAAKLGRAGSKVVPHADSVRRVVQCAAPSCERTVQYRGDEKLWAAGWGSTWKGDVRTWQCPGCYTPPAAPAEAPSYRVDPAMLEVAELPSGPARVKLERQVVRLLNVDPKRGESYLKAIVAHLGEKKGAGAVRWRALLELLPTVAAEGARRKRRLPPLTPGPPLVSRRRDAAEPGKVFAFRMVSSERATLERLAKAQGVKAKDVILLWIAAAESGVLRPAAPPPPPAPPAERGEAWQRASIATPGLARAAVDRMVEQGQIDELEDFADHVGVSLAKARRAAEGTLGELLREEPATSVHVELVDVPPGTEHEALVGACEDAWAAAGPNVTGVSASIRTPADPLSRPCPKCRASIGERCRSDNGAIRRTVAHEERLAPAKAEEPPRADSLVVACGGCMAEVGARCTNAKGQPCPPHRARKEAAERQALTWEDVVRLAKLCKITPHSGANSPGNVWLCVKLIRAQRSPIPTLTPYQFTRKALRDLRPDAGTDSFDIAIAYLIEQGEMARVSGSKVGHPTERLLLHGTPDASPARLHALSRPVRPGRARRASTPGAGPARPTAPG